MEITVNELLNLLNQIEKPTFVHITMETEVRMNKKDNPYFGRVKKVTSGNYLLCSDYEQRVNNNSEKEGQERTFKSELPKGKKHISKCVLVDTKTESVHYVMLERFDEIKTKVSYYMDGNEIEKQLISDWLRSSYKSKKQTQERKVMVFTPKLTNIREISIDKMKYTVLRQNVNVEN